MSRIENGGEFCGNEFKDFCKKCGIVRHKTTPYTPQQNGVAERMNRMLMEKERSMLSSVGIGQEFLKEETYDSMLLSKSVTHISIG